MAFYFFCFYFFKYKLATPTLVISLNYLNYRHINDLNLINFNLQIHYLPHDFMIILNPVQVSFLHLILKIPITIATNLLLIIINLLMIVEHHQAHPLILITITPVHYHYLHLKSTL
jgi:hypothetical protein